jgi:hypothetical protein
MNFGYKTVEQIARLQQDLQDLGMKLGRTPYVFNDQELASVFPDGDDALPIYTRDAALYTGVLTEICAWVQGIQWARDYDRMLRVSNVKRRQQREQNALNERLVKVLSQKQPQE